MDSSKNTITKGGVYKFPIKNFKGGLKCVYKTVYKGGYFYIGCTNDFKRRMSGHACGLACVVNSGRPISVEILEVGSDINSLKKIESSLILSHKIDKKMLNTKSRMIKVSKHSLEKMGLERGKLTPAQLSEYMLANK